jgi:hypothetical protein
MKKEATPKNAKRLTQKTSDEKRGNPKKRKGPHSKDLQRNKRQSSQKFSTTSKVGRPAQQLKMSIMTIPSNLCANVQCGQQRRYRAQPRGTLAHKFFL